MAWTCRVSRADCCCSAKVTPKLEIRLLSIGAFAKPWRRASSPTATIRNTSQARNQPRLTECCGSGGRFFASRVRHIEPSNWLLDEGKTRELIGNERFEGV